MMQGEGQQTVTCYIELVNINAGLTIRL